MKKKTEKLPSKYIPFGQEENKLSRKSFLSMMQLVTKSVKEVENLVWNSLSGRNQCRWLSDIYGGGRCEKVLGQDVKASRLTWKDVDQSKCGIRMKNLLFWFSKDYI